MMKQIIFDTYSDLSEQSAIQIAAIINQKPDALLCFPAGETSIGTFNYLIELNKTGKVSFKECKIVGLDEWAGLGKLKSENCYSFLRKHLFDHIDLSEENLCFFDGDAADLKNECDKTDAYIQKHGPIDMMLLGVGMNGHLGLNEPGTSFDLYSHVVHLDETTRIVGQKYFTGKVVLSKGISLGMRYILESKTVILQISGSRKAEIAKQLIDSEISIKLPASVLKSHKNAYLMMDKEAAERI